MKLTCDLCGASLQVDAGGRSATCVNCGLTYSMERLREKLQAGKPQPSVSVPVTPAPPAAPAVYEVTDWEPVAPTPPVKEAAVPPVYATADWTPVTAAPDPARPQPFSLSPFPGRGDVTGRILQGGIGLGDTVYINGDYTHPCRVYSLNDNGNCFCAKAGETVELYLHGLSRHMRKNIQTVTGDPNPQLNAYNYPGSVWEYFQYVLQTRFPEYQIQAQVPRAGLSIPLSFLLWQNGTPRMAILLVDSNNSKGRYQAKKAARLFAPEGVGFVHFFSNYRNDLSYVIDRIRSAK